jgi:hypothetical protein
MPLSVSFDDATRILARQVYGIADNDAMENAADAMELALQEIASTTHLVGQEGEGSLALTGVQSYSLADVDPAIVRLVKVWTSFGALEIMRKAEFVTRYPDYANYSIGTPRIAVLWGDDSLYVWPDESGVTLGLLYYKIVDPNNAGGLLWALVDVARKHLDAAKETRAINVASAEMALKKIREGETRSVDRPLRFLVEERVAEVNRFKRGRK